MKIDKQNQHQTTSEYDIDWRKKHNVPLTRKQEKATKQRGADPKAGTGKPYHRGEKCVPVVDSSGHTLIVPESTAKALVEGTV